MAGSTRTGARLPRRPATILVLAAAAIGAGLIAFIAVAPAQASDPNALWRVVHDLCVTDMKVRGAPAPCLSVDLARRYAALKDIRGETQVLVIPTDRVSGIESAKLLAPGAPNYWQDAWDARILFERRARQAVPRQDIGLAINSIYGRSQNQLHIHIDCVRPDVVEYLRANEGVIGVRWSKLRSALAGHRYRARRLMGADLGPRDPFKLLAQSDPTARTDMGRETLVVIGASFRGGKPGFILLSDRASFTPFDKAAGEDLLDHQCAILATTGQAHHDQSS
ncbi:MAG: CDP-diacylglycerol diphosphatase [Caulobacteraceae bacterium]